MKTLDRWLVALGTPLVAGAIALGAASADEGGPVAPAGGRVLGAAGAEGTESLGSPPARPTNLPSGVRLDPNTLTLTGVDLAAAPGTQVASWDRLKSYEYQEGLPDLPDELKMLDGQGVTMAGFLLPVYEFEDIHRFLLVGSHWSCCYGVPPTLTGVVRVDLAKGEQGLPNTSEPLRVVGTFRIREEKQEGYVLHIFQVDDAKVQIIGY